MALPTFIFDTSPLITLAGANLDGQSIIERMFQFIQVVVVETVAQEATANLIYPDAKLIQLLLRSGRITRIPIPTTPVDNLINTYPGLGTGKGKGERDTIRLGISTANARVVIDDQLAFFVAARFELNPITLLDLIVDLARSHNLSKTLALKMVNAVSRRYAPVSIQHTVYKLNEINDDSNNH